MLMTLSFTLKIKFVVEIIRKSCVGNLLRELEFHIQCSLPSLTGLSVLASQHGAEMSVKCT